MYKHCNTEDSARRQRQLEQCLLELMEEQPYGAVTVGQICDQAGLSRKSFYRYFNSKQGCLFALLDHTIMAGAAYFIPDSGADLSQLAFCTRIFEFWQKQTPLLNALEKNSLSLQLLQRIVRHILVEEPDYARFLGISQNYVMEHVVYHIGGLMGLVLTWHHEGYQKTAAQMGQILYQLTNKEVKQ